MKGVRVGDVGRCSEVRWGLGWVSVEGEDSVDLAEETMPHIGQPGLFLNAIAQLYEVGLWLVAN